MQVPDIEPETMFQAGFQAESLPTPAAGGLFNYVTATLAILQRELFTSGLQDQTK